MKEYPVKVKGSELVDICECGHQWCFHDIIIFNDGTDECEKCACPKYKFEQNITMDKAIKLEHIIYDKAEKHNYTL